MRDANAHSGVLVILENDVITGGLECDLKVEHAAVGAAMDSNDAFIGADLRAILRDVARGLPNDSDILAGFDLQKLVVDDLAGFRGLTPEIMTADMAVSEPDSAMMNVILFFALDAVLHRPVPGEAGFAVDPIDGIEEWPWHIGEAILREELAVDFNAKAVFELGDLDAGFSGACGEGKACRKDGRGQEFDGTFKGHEKAHGRYQL